MGKTDKELTIEVVNNFIANWNGKTLQSESVIDLIQCVYKTISELPNYEK